MIYGSEKGNRMRRYLPIVVILIGVWLRWYHINWSLPYIFHPDETRLLYAVNEISWENLNPKFFAYGSLPIYVLKILHSTIHKNFFLVGRALSAFFGSLTLILLYVFGTRFFSQRVALLSTALLAFTVLHIQLSHFLTVDVMLTFFVLFAFYVLASLIESSGGFWRYLLVGVVIGLTLATKISALPLYGVFLGVHTLVLLKLRWTPPLRWRPSRCLWGSFLFALLLSGIVFLLCEPYALLDFKEFSRQIKEQSDMVRGLWQPPYTIQYEHTLPYGYHLKQLLCYSMGLPLGLLTLFGSLFIIGETVYKGIKDRDRLLRTLESRWCIVVLILLWVVLVFGSVGGFKVKFLRYMLPLIPFLCVLGAIFVEQLIHRFPSWKLVICLVVSIIIGFSAFYAVAFVSIYSHDDPRIQASKWISEHVKPGSMLLTESWEFVSIVPVANHHPGQYRIQHLDLYAPDSETKIHNLARQLREGDVIFLATKRLYGSIPRVPDRYPFTINYYKQLFDGKLGFSPVEAFTSYPSLFGITFNDDFADESFSVYDHPKVILFQKTKKLSEHEIYAAIVMAPPIQDTDPLLKRFLAFPERESNYVPIKRATTISPEKVSSAEAIRKESSEWRIIVIWLLTVEVLALIALPLTTLTFRKLPGMGFAVSKVFGILLPAYFVWILVSLNLFTYTRGVIVVVVYILFLVALLTWLKHLSFFMEIMRTTWRTFFIHEGVFLLAFSVFLGFRAYNPDIFWSESSMDFSFLNVLTRTATFPPPDPWISGFPLNYYYFGHYIVATLTRLTGIAPQFTYNLAFALFPALVIVEVFSLLYYLTKRYLWGLVGVLFSTMIGNLDGFFLLVDTWRGKEHYYRFFRCAHEVVPHTVHEFPFWTFLFVDLHAHLLNMPFLVTVFLVGFNLLAEHSRFGIQGLRIAPSLFLISLSLFLYTLLVGTLGVISSWDYPTAIIFLLLIAFVQTYGNFQNVRDILGLGRFRPLFLYGLFVGVLSIIRNWDVMNQWFYPIILIFLILALVETYKNFRDIHHFLFRIRPLFFVIGIIIPGSIFLYTPFYLYFYRKGMTLGRVGALTTQLSDFLTMFGFFFFVILSFLIFQAWRIRESGKPWRVVIVLLLLGLGMYMLVVNVFQIDYATFLFVISLLLFSSYLFAKQSEQQFAPRLENTFIWICLVYACLILAGCEIVFVRDFLQGGEYKRMNTIFKFYIPAWFLLSFTATYMLFQLKRINERKHLSTYYPLPTASSSRFFMFSKWIWLICFGLFCVCSSVFPVMAIYARRHHQDVYNREYFPPTLDGLAYIKAKNPDEYRAIRWLNEHVAGAPVILEATKADYLYEYARISSNTGLPTVLGWWSHVEQREHWGQAGQRASDVNVIYTSADMQNVLQLLRKYQVIYIYVGETERKTYPEEGLKKFEEHPERFEVVFQSGRTVIYRVQ
jgi:uncharacterized membrane protein/4-amino-4-deoxy-L-arabinose transferase-like glycosyltransferase